MNTAGAYENTQKKLKETANETLVIPSKECEESDEKFEEIFKITRQRSSGPNIVETERHVLTPQENGATRKTVIKDVYAKLTTRNSRKHVSQKEENLNQDPSSKETLSVNGLRKRANKINNILKHISAHDLNAQAMIVAKVVDRNGPEFAAKVIKIQKKFKVN